MLFVHLTWTDCCGIRWVDSRAQRREAMTKRTKKTTMTKRTRKYRKVKVDINGLRTDLRYEDEEDFLLDHGWVRLPPDRTEYPGIPIVACPKPLWQHHDFPFEVFTREGALVAQGGRDSFRMFL